MSARSQTWARTSGPATAGALAFGACAAWTIVAAAAAGSSAGPTAGLILLSGLVVALSWLAASRSPSLVPAAIVGAAIVTMVASGDALLRYDPRQGPLGYPNAWAAFLVQASIAALMLSVVGPGRLLRVGGALAGVAFAVALILTRSWTAAVMLPAVVLLGLFVERTRGARAAVLVSGCLCGALLAITLVLGASGLGTGASAVDRAIRSTISEQRVVLWGEALSLTAQEPLVGVGPGRFSSSSPTASSDEDLRWAHQEFLQTGAESGIPGFLFAVGIFAWGFVALWLRSPARVAVLAAAGLALLGIHASVDYVLHFPGVALAGAAVLGTGLGASGDEPIAERMSVEGVTVGRPA